MPPLCVLAATVLASLACVLLLPLLLLLLLLVVVVVVVVCASTHCELLPCVYTVGVPKYRRGTDKRKRAADQTVTLCWPAICRPVAVRACSCVY